jgi:hypothetical protein
VGQRRLHHAGVPDVGEEVEWFSAQIREAGGPWRRGRREGQLDALWPWGSRASAIRHRARIGFMAAVTRDKKEGRGHAPAS